MELPKLKATVPTRRVPMKKRILFVDDDPQALSALKALVSPMARDWTLSFALGGAEALKLVRNSVFEVVVTALEMPEIDGRQVLEQVLGTHPATIRVAFSGRKDEHLLAQSIGLVHQALPRPCSFEDLTALVGNACLVGSQQVDEDVRWVIGRVDHLPVVPRLYQDLRTALEAEEVTVKVVGEIIRQDVAMTARILNLVNSAFFGLRRTVESPQEAVAFLGTETIQALVLVHGLFDQVSALGTEALALEDVWRHGLSVARGARALAAMEGLSRHLMAEAFMGGLLHDVGILVLAQHFPERYDRVLRHAAAERLPISGFEKREFGVSHAEVGAYLLGLWGIQSAVLKVVSLHHTPGLLRATSFNPVLAVHLADDLCGAQGHHVLFERPGLDHRTLLALGLVDHLPGWRRVLNTSNW